MLARLKHNAAVIGALAGVVAAAIAILQFVVVGPMNQRFDAQDKRFDDIRSDMNARFDIQDKYIEARFDAVDQRFDAVDQRFDAVDQRFDAVDQRFTDKNQNINQRFDDLRAEMNQRLDRLTNEVSALRDLVVGIGERVSRNEGAITLIREHLQAEGAAAPPPNP